MTEWDNIGPNIDSRLKHVSLADDASARKIANTLRKKIDIREGYDGLEISTTSFVGCVDVGPIRLAITPKLAALPLTRLLRYAYGLRDLSIIQETIAPTARHGLHDLLIEMLAAEMDELLHRGLARHYVPQEDRLESPRGALLIAEFVKRAGVTEARLPCRYFERLADWHLNRVLRAGVLFAAQMTEDRTLRHRLFRSADMFGNVTVKATVNARDIDLAERGLTRLTQFCSSALSIIRLLHDMRGVAFDSGGIATTTPGFLFDMNAFFQRLLSRFLHENLSTRRIQDEFVLRGAFAYALGANPKRRAAPKPRPDFGLFERNTLAGFLDAKYRDIWERGFPADWLYQASIYALASPVRVCVLLYATMHEEACDEKINIQQPMAWSNDLPGSVILRPVSLLKMATLLSTPNAVSTIAARRRWADELVRLSTG